MLKPLALFIVLSILFLVSCNQQQSVNSVSWTGSSHSIADTIVTESDTIIIQKSIYLAHQITITDTGSTIITRSQYGSPRISCQLFIPDSIQLNIFSLLADSAIKSFNPNEPAREEGRMYCGFNYLLEVNTQKHQFHFNYLPTKANPTLIQLHEILEGILNAPTLGNAITKDTTKLDEVIFEKVKGFNPSPPVMSTVKFTPPAIEATE